jgi:hypothetical protein
MRDAGRAGDKAMNARDRERATGGVEEYVWALAWVRANRGLGLKEVDAGDP